jgi:hypothetical protein
MAHEISGGNYERSPEHRVDLTTEEWTEKLAGAPIYKKTALVHIRPATPGELVVTTLADGSDETENTAGESEVVVTNPSGEKQIVSLEKAVLRYDLTDTPGLFSAKGMVRAIDNPFDHSISILAPWGSPQRGDAGCKIAALYDPSEPDSINTDRYLIGKDEFIETYGDHPVDVAAGETEVSIPSAQVLQALEECNAQGGAWLSEMRSLLGMKGLHFVNLLPMFPDTDIIA